MTQYIAKTKRVRQRLGSISMPSSKSSFDEVIQYFQEQKEYWENQIGVPFILWDRYSTITNPKGIGMMEEHTFDEIFIDEDYVDTRDGSSYVPAVYGERDMTEGEIAFQDEQITKNKEARRKNYEQMKKEFDVS